MNNHDTSARRLVLAIAVGIGVCGCATTDQLSQARQFSTAAAALATATNQAFTEINDANSEYKMSEVALGRAELTPDTLSGVLDKNNRLKARQDILNALGKYATALNGLATADTTTAIDKAATDLSGSVSSLGSGYQTLTGHSLGVSRGDLAVIATAVKALGEAYANEKRYEAIKSIVPTADKWVQTVCADLASDLKSSPGTYQTDLQSKYVADFEAYRAEQAGLSYSAKLARLESLRSETRALAVADTSISKVADSARAAL